MDYMIKSSPKDSGLKKQLRRNIEDLHDMVVVESRSKELKFPLKKLLALHRDQKKKSI